MYSKSIWFIAFEQQSGGGVGELLRRVHKGASPAI